ncbi:ABC transporter permease [Streptomyces sp. NPDC055037]
MANSHPSSTTETSPPKPPSTAATLVQTLWFPVFFVIGFMLCYLAPFHSPQPHDVPVAVVGSHASELRAALDHAQPGGFDISAVPDREAARQAVSENRVVAAYDPAHQELFTAKAAGSGLATVTEETFTGVAQGATDEPVSLKVTDLVPTASGDGSGAGLFYLVMTLNVVSYIVVLMLLQGLHLTARVRALATMGMGAFATVFTYIFAVSLDVIPNRPVVMLIAFLFTQTVSWTLTALLPIVKQYITGVGVGLFVLLSIPSSDGAVPVHLVPQPFRWLHEVMPLGQAFDAIRSVLYYDARGVWHHILVLSGWLLAAALLLAWTVRRMKRTMTPDDVQKTKTEEAGVVPVIAG